MLTPANTALSVELARRLFPRVNSRMCGACVKSMQEVQRLYEYALFYECVLVHAGEYINYEGVEIE